MIHQYQMNGYNIVIDVFSASVHVTDLLAYDGIHLLDSGLSREDVQIAQMSSYSFLTEANT